MSPAELHRLVSVWCVAATSSPAPTSTSSAMATSATSFWGPPFILFTSALATFSWGPTSTWKFFLAPSGPAVDFTTFRWWSTPSVEWWWLHHRIGSGVLHQSCGVLYHSSGGDHSGGIRTVCLHLFLFHRQTGCGLNYSRGDGALHQWNGGKLYHRIGGPPPVLWSALPQQW